MIEIFYAYKLRNLKSITETILNKLSYKIKLPKSVFIPKKTTKYFLIVKLTLTFAKPIFCYAPTLEIYTTVSCGRLFDFRFREPNAQSTTN